MSDHEERSAAERLQELEDQLHRDQIHPNYDYCNVQIESTADIYNDVQFSLINGWETNDVLNGLHGGVVLFREEKTNAEIVTSTKCTRFFKRKKEGK